MKWEYHVVHLNVEEPVQDGLNISSPEAASEKLKGSLSPDFIKKQFPDKYKENDTDLHPATQLSKYLNNKGLDEWELFETIQISNMLFLIMKRQIN